MIKGVGNPCCQCSHPRRPPPARTGPTRTPVPSHPPSFFLIGREHVLSEVRRDRVARTMAGVEVGREIDLGELPALPVVG